MKTNNRQFKVSGAGIIRIGKDHTSKCGGATGFSFGVSWGKYGYAGGVIDKKDAKKFAEFILKTLNS